MNWRVLDFTDEPPEFETFLDAVLWGQTWADKTGRDALIDHWSPDYPQDDPNLGWAVVHAVKPRSAVQKETK